MSVALAFVLALAPATALDAAKAEAAATEAMALHADGKLAEASAALARAYAIYPDRDYLYMRGIIEREAGRCDTAVELFEAFLAESPPLVDVQATQTELEKCRATMPEAGPQPQPQPQPEPAPPPTVDTPAPPTAVDRPAPRDAAPRARWWADPVGGALFGSGVVVAVIGGGLLGGAAARANAADAADTAGDYRNGIASARALNAAGFAVLGVGTALVVGGIVRWAVVARRSRDLALD